MIKKSEVILFSAAIAGGVLKQIGFTGATFLCALSFMGLMLFYLLFGFIVLNDLSLRKVFKKSEYKNVKPYKLILAFLVSLTFIFTILGILFMLNKWGANPALRGFLWIGTLITLVVLVISGSFSIIKYSKFSLAVLLRSSVFFLIAIMLLLFA